MEFLKAMLAEINTKKNATQEKMDAETKAIQAKTKPIQDKLDTYQQMIESGLKPQETENKTGLEEKEVTNMEVNPGKIETNPEKTEYGEHREIPKKVAAVKLSGKKEAAAQRPDLAAGRCGKPNELIRGLRIQQEFGCLLQEGVPSCSSGTRQGNPHQENSDRRNLRIAD
jgi:hypothetical protein